ncbi:hypothetical protein C8T65DRAFT_746327 [Cerioporus squamosus]|nr:hypothetical protein C8T65DRAFT_746327 [Cerioporus squamosus]
MPVKKTTDAPSKQYTLRTRATAVTPPNAPSQKEDPSHRSVPKPRPKPVKKTTVPSTSHDTPFTFPAPVTMPAGGLAALVAAAELAHAQDLHEIPAPQPNIIELSEAGAPAQYAKDDGDEDEDEDVPLSQVVGQRWTGVEDDGGESAEGSGEGARAVEGSTGVGQAAWNGGESSEMSEGEAEVVAQIKESREAKERMHSFLEAEDPLLNEDFEIVEPRSKSRTAGPPSKPPSKMLKTGTVPFTGGKQQSPEDVAKPQRAVATKGKEASSRKDVSIARPAKSSYSKKVAPDSDDEEPESFDIHLSIRRVQQPNKAFSVRSDVPWSDVQEKIASVLDRFPNRLSLSCQFPWTKDVDYELNDEDDWKLLLDQVISQADTDRQKNRGKGAAKKHLITVFETGRPNEDSAVPSTGANTSGMPTRASDHTQGKRGLTRSKSVTSSEQEAHTLSGNTGEIAIDKKDANTLALIQRGKYRCAKHDSVCVVSQDGKHYAMPMSILCDWVHLVKMGYATADTMPKDVRNKVLKTVAPVQEARRPPPSQAVDSSDQRTHVEPSTSTPSTSASTPVPMAPASAAAAPAAPPAASTVPITPISSAPLAMPANSFGVQTNLGINPAGMIMPQNPGLPFALSPIQVAQHPVVLPASYGTIPQSAVVPIQTPQGIVYAPVLPSAGLGHAWPGPSASPQLPASATHVPHGRTPVTPSSHHHRYQRYPSLSPTLHLSPISLRRRTRADDYDVYAPPPPTLVGRFPEISDWLVGVERDTERNIQGQSLVRWSNCFRAEGIYKLDDLVNSEFTPETLATTLNMPFDLASNLCTWADEDVYRIRQANIREEKRAHYY